jgi:hypothetical protein
MRVIYVSQLLAAAIAIAAMAGLGTQAEVVALAYGTVLGWMITLLTRRGTDRALLNAVDNTTHAMVAMYSGFVLRYAVAILGLLVGLRVMQLNAEPMLAGFILMIMVQALAAIFMAPGTDKREA